MLFTSPPLEKYQRNVLPPDTSRWDMLFVKPFRNAVIGCAVHQDFSADLMVLPGCMHVVSGSDGGFVLPTVDLDRAEVHVCHPLHEPASRSFDKLSREKNPLEFTLKRCE